MSSKFLSGRLFSLLDSIEFPFCLSPQDEVALELREFLSRSAVVAAETSSTTNLPTSPLKIDPESPVQNADLPPAKPMEAVSPTAAAK